MNGEDVIIKQNVDAQLRWDPEVDDTDIATKVRDGIVTLSGFARNYFERHQAEVTIKRVTGMTAVVNDLQVRLVGGQKSTDPEIAREALAALKSQLPDSWQTIKPVVHEGRDLSRGNRRMAVPTRASRSGHAPHSRRSGGT